MLVWLSAPSTKKIDSQPNDARVGLRSPLTPEITTSKFEVKKCSRLDYNRNEIIGSDLSQAETLRTCELCEPGVAHAAEPTGVLQSSLGERALFFVHCRKM